MYQFKIKNLVANYVQQERAHYIHVML